MFFLFFFFYDRISCNASFDFNQLFRPFKAHSYEGILSVRLFQFVEAVVRLSIDCPSGSRRTHTRKYLVCVCSNIFASQSIVLQVQGALIREILSVRLFQFVEAVVRLSIDCPSGSRRTHTRKYLVCVCSNLFASQSIVLQVQGALIREILSVRLFQFVEAVVRLSIDCPSGSRRTHTRKYLVCVCSNLFASQSIVLRVQGAALIRGNT